MNTQCVFLWRVSLMIGVLRFWEPPNGKTRGLCQTWFDVRPAFLLVSHCLPQHRLNFHRALAAQNAWVAYHSIKSASSIYFDLFGRFSSVNFCSIQHQVIKFSSKSPISSKNLHSSQSRSEPQKFSQGTRRFADAFRTKVHLAESQLTSHISNISSVTKKSKKILGTGFWNHLPF